MWTVKKKKQPPKTATLLRAKTIPVLKPREVCLGAVQNQARERGFHREEMQFPANYLETYRFSWGGEAPKVSGTFLFPFWQVAA